MIISEQVQDAIIRLSEGNPGAIKVICDLISHCRNPVSVILLLEGSGLKGNQIWDLYKDLCGQSLEITMIMLRALQVGSIAKNLLAAAIAAGRPFTPEEIDIYKDTVLEEMDHVWPIPII